jgi:hypothetical protein
MRERDVPGPYKEAKQDRADIPPPTNAPDGAVGAARRRIYAGESWIEVDIDQPIYVPERTELSHLEYGPPPRAKVAGGANNDEQHETPSAADPQPHSK